MSAEHSPIIEAGYGALLVAGSVADIITHNVDRQYYPPIIGEHIGNFGPTLIGTFTTATAGSLIAQYGRDNENAHVESFGKKLEKYSPAIWMAVNFVHETQMYARKHELNQYIGDTIVGGRIKKEVAERLQSKMALREVQWVI
jgi:hypothetical protein